jgi:hypothetical protein
MRKSNADEYRQTDNAQVLAMATTVGLPQMVLADAGLRPRDRSAGCRRVRMQQAGGAQIAP